VIAELAQGETAGEAATETTKKENQLIQRSYVVSNVGSDLGFDGVLLLI